MMDESLFWADQIARVVKERAETDPVLKKTVKEKGYICLDEKTPSGHIHIGSGRGWVIHDTVAKAMRDNGMKAKFILSSDDIDPFDKFPTYLSKEKYEKYLGVPFRDIPSPEKGYENYADYFFKECTDKFEEFGIEAELTSTGQMYDDGKFNESIKIALNNTDKIHAIYSRIYAKTVATDKLPFNPICEKCGKIGTTIAYEWNPETEMVRYRCSPDLVKWAKGCGYEGEKSPYNGAGKLPWKVEWAAKWPTFGVAYETAGKDHFTKGGSREVAIAISDEIFDFTPPYPSTRTETGEAYEFFNVGGAKMSTSKGTGIGFAEISNHIPPKMLRYLLVRSRPKTVIDFDPYQTNKLLLLYDNYDFTERIYFGKESEVTDRDSKQEKRIYVLAYVGKLPKQMPAQLSLGHASTVIQTSNFNVKKAVQILQETGYTPTKLSKDDLDYIEERLRGAEKWVKGFAPEAYKFTVLGDLPNLTAEQSKLLLGLANVLKKKKGWHADELESAIYKYSKGVATPKGVFTAAYQNLLGKNKGPRLAPFILTLGVEFVIERFSK